MSADMECSMRVHSKCQCCVMKMHDVLRSIRGVYSVTWDVEKDLCTISGEVEPSVLLKAVLRTGEHSELVTVKLKHPQLRQRYYNYGSYAPTNGGYHMPYYRDAGYSHRSSANYPYYETNDQYYPYGLQRDPYGPQRDPPLVEYPSSYNYNYNYTNNTNDYQYPLPRATYVPSYPSQEHDQYDNFDNINPCSIM